MHLALLILLSTPPGFEAAVPVLTVCDVLANRNAYLNSDVIVVGRFELRGGSIDAYDFIGAPVAIVINSRSVHLLNDDGTIRKPLDPPRQ